MNGCGRLLGLFLIAALGSVVVRAEEGAAPRDAVRLKMEEVEIRGELERPEVFYIIPRREMEMDLGSLSKDYRDEILEPLLPERFQERVRGAAEGDPRSER